MLFEDKKWLKIWSRKGKITGHYLFKRVNIDLGMNNISILKIGQKYRIKIPENKNLNLSKYGFAARNNYFVGYFVVYFVS